MAKFKTSSNKFAVIISGDKTTDNYYSSIRLQVVGVVTKQSDLSSWVENAQGEQMYYGEPCYLPENKKALKFLKQYVNGKTFKSKYFRHINAVHKYDTKQQKKLILRTMLEKINHLIDNSF